MRDDVQLSVVPVPAVYKENDHSYSLAKTGYFTFEFMPMTLQEDNTKKVDYSRRRAMIVTLKNVREIIDLDTKEVLTYE